MPRKCPYPQCLKSEIEYLDSDYQHHLLIAHFDALDQPTRRFIMTSRLGIGQSLEEEDYVPPEKTSTKTQTSPRKTEAIGIQEKPSTSSVGTQYSPPKNADEENADEKNAGEENAEDDEPIVVRGRPSIVLPIEFREDRWFCTECNFKTKLKPDIYRHLRTKHGLTFVIEKKGKLCTIKDQ